MHYKFGVKKDNVVRISAPPIFHPCFYGIDPQVATELIAATSSVDEIRDFIHESRVRKELRPAKHCDVRHRLDRTDGQERGQRSNPRE